MKHKILVIFAFLISHSAVCQKIDDIIGNYKGVNAEGFLQPLADVLTSTFNTGSAQKSSIDSGFHMYLGIVTTNSFIMTDNLRFFEGQTPPLFTPGQTATASTIIGPSQTTRVAGTNGTSYTFPAGLGLNRIMLAVPQLTIGNIAGTELSVRYFAYNVGEEFGKISIMGGSVRHDFGRYFLKDSKFTLTGEVGYQELKTGKYSTLKALKAGVFAGQQHKNFHYFAHVGYQQGKMNLNYQNPEENLDFSVSLTNKNPLLFGIGAGIKIAIFKIHAQANFISPVVAALGIGLNF